MGGKTLLLRWLREPRALPWAITCQAVGLQIQSHPNVIAQINVILDAAINDTSRISMMPKASKQVAGG